MAKYHIKPLTMTSQYIGLIHNDTYNKMTKSLYMLYTQNVKIIDTQNEL
ncbi:tRNA uridine 5-carboxymethylaminomethyl modification enzyme MnmG [Gossypium arboreum]|uniref:tRNA uridine 5-carboxymethylaminomethyl modification enzyme MnmG n=1 Tax=Gossypium arboreum TaxID=29729 RepID=A0A0B0P1C3_GOSAR|nr:tRNA uridine 5-carboxymethylaminomethyl modification enzyme MnmG [Gossypium arboreum]